MRLGIFGSKADPQCQALAQVLAKKGAQAVLVESQGLNRKEPCTFDGEVFSIGGQRLDDIAAWYLRYIMSPIPPAFESDERYYLYADWFVDYMQKRERFGFQLSWLLTMGLMDVPVVNPPEHGGVVQMKPFQLAAARHAGFLIPRSLITNDPNAVRQFANEVDEVVFKPSMGGGLCEPLDEEALDRLDRLVAAPVTFQERIRGVSVRATFVASELVSTVRIPTDSLDYRNDPDYSEGNQEYEEVDLPKEIVEKCLVLMRDCGLVFSGIDFVCTDDGSLVFLEANSSPIYLDIERKTGVPITQKLADFLLRIGNEPHWYREQIQRAKRTKSFLSYALPFAPNEMVGGDD